MQSPVFFYVDMRGRSNGNNPLNSVSHFWGALQGPLPLHSIPNTNNNSKTKSNNKTKTKNKIKVVYTEDLTHPLTSAGIVRDAC
jgi:hypothetical protein